LGGILLDAKRNTSMAWSNQQCSASGHLDSSRFIYLSITVLNHSHTIHQSQVLFRLNAESVEYTNFQWDRSWIMIIDIVC
jgi:hypothetical protein